jgi:glycosyltransferase involved in cell wall biosynthesis
MKDIRARNALRSITSVSAMPAEPVVLIGHPFQSTGRGEHLRAIRRAFLSAGITPAVYNLWPKNERDIEDDTLETASIREVPPDSIRIFHCNGDEAVGAMVALEKRQRGIFKKGFNIIFPAWELPCYPQAWARALDAYDEIWTASSFVHQGICAAVRTPAFHLPNACEPHIERALDRHYFGVRETAYVVLLFFDLWSYTTRKNPWATITCFKQVLDIRREVDLQLVIKTNHASHDRSVMSALTQAVHELGNNALLIDRTISDNEIKNLIRCCNCLISLHRSEGFGRGPAEAMFLGKPVIATGWSGNMEYMGTRVSFPVPYKLIPVTKGEYLFEEGQMWADPDIDKAARLLLALVDKPSYGERIGRRAKRHMMRNFSDSTLGHRYRARILEIRDLTGLRAPLGS